MQKLKDALARLFYGRYGTDSLNTCMILVGLALYVASWISGIVYISYAGLILYILAIFRMLSRNTAKRRAELNKFRSITGGIKTRITQAKNRAKNRKQYKYFRCAKCHSYLKLPRGVGEVTVTCGKCKNQFRKKA